MHRLFLLLLLLPGLAPAAQWSEPDIAGLVTDRAIAEMSGLAASHAFPGHYWAINDSGSPAELYLVDARGRHRGTVRVEGAPNVDWEDLAGFELDGRRYLLVADTGDNGGLRQELQLYVFEEPTTLDAPVQPAWVQRFRWPDGPRDCEAVAVDAAAGEVLLVSKKRVPPELMRVPLKPGGDRPAVAELLGLLPGIEQPSARDLSLNPVYGRYRSQVTAADLAERPRVGGTQLPVGELRGAARRRRLAGRAAGPAHAAPGTALAAPGGSPRLGRGRPRPGHRQRAAALALPALSHRKDRQLAVFNHFHAGSPGS